MTARKSERLLNLLITLLVSRTYVSKARIREVIEAYHDAGDEAFEKMFERDKEELRSLGIPIEVGYVDRAVVVGPGYRLEGTAVGLPANAHERPVDLPAGQPFGALDRVRDRADRLVDVDDDALLETGRGHGPVAHDREPSVAADLADEGAHLAGADVDADEDRFSFHRVVRLRSARGRYRATGSGAG